MNKSELKAIFINAKATDAKYIGVSIQTEGSSQPEIIINPNPNFDAKFDYYMEAYDDDLILIAAKGKKDIRITAAGQGNSFEDIECQLIGERGKGWRELIAGAIDNAYEKMIATTPPTTEEEQTHCEMIKEAVKGMFINESRTAAEAEFIKTHIVDYDKDIHDRHVTLWDLGENDENFSDDDAEGVTLSVQVTIFSESDEVELAREIKSIMKENDFSFEGRNGDDSKPEDGIYMKAQRFSKFYEMEE